MGPNSRITFGLDRLGHAPQQWRPWQRQYGPVAVFAGRLPFGAEEMPRLLLRWRLVWVRAGAVVVGALW